MSCARRGNVIVANRERALSAPPCESLPIGCEYRSVDRPHERPTERVFTCLYRAGRRGMVREPEGIATPLPAISSERAWSKH